MIENAVRAQPPAREEPASTRRRRRRVVLAAAAGVLLLGPVAGPGLAAAKTVADPHGTVTVRSGQPLVLTFQTSDGVGIAWTLRSNSRPAVLRLSKVTSTSNTSDPQAVGGYSTKRYGFRALHGGVARLVFVRDFRGATSTRSVLVRVR